MVLEPVIIICSNTFSQLCYVIKSEFLVFSIVYSVLI